MSPRVYPFRVIDVTGWQVLYFLPGDAELDSFVHPNYRADRDRHFLTAPEVSLLEKNMRDVMIARVDHQSLDSSDVAVRGMDLFAATHGYLAQGDFVIDDGLRDVSCARSGPRLSRK